MFKLGSQLAAHVEQNKSCKDLGLQMCKKNPIGQSICKIALVRGFSSKVSSRASDLDARSAWRTPLHACSRTGRKPLCLSWRPWSNKVWHIGAQDNRGNKQIATKNLEGLILRGEKRVACTARKTSYMKERVMFSRFLPGIASTFDPFVRLARPFSSPRMAIPFAQLWRWLRACPMMLSQDLKFPLVAWLKPQKLSTHGPPKAKKVWNVNSWLGKIMFNWIRMVPQKIIACYQNGTSQINWKKTARWKVISWHWVLKNGRSPFLPFLFGWHEAHHWCMSWMLTWSLLPAHWRWSHWSILEMCIEVMPQGPKNHKWKQRHTDLTCMGVLDMSLFMSILLKCVLTSMRMQTMNMWPSDMSPSVVFASLYSYCHLFGCVSVNELEVHMELLRSFKGIFCCDQTCHDFGKLDPEFHLHAFMMVTFLAWHLRRFPEVWALLGWCREDQGSRWSSEEPDQGGGKDMKPC